MTVKQLIAKLKKLDPKAEVVINRAEEYRVLNADDIEVDDVYTDDDDDLTDAVCLNSWG